MRVDAVWFGVPFSILGRGVARLATTGLLARAKAYCLSESLFFFFFFFLVEVWLRGIVTDGKEMSNYFALHSCIPAFLQD